jgi:hypothetical protein
MYETLKNTDSPTPTFFIQKEGVTRGFSWDVGSVLWARSFYCYDDNKQNKKGSLTTRLPITTVARKKGTQTLDATHIQSHIDSEKWIVCIIKGIGSREGMVTVTTGVHCDSLGQKIRLESDLHLESRVSKMYDATNRGTFDVKWRELDFTHLLSSSLKCVLKKQSLFL